MNEAIIILLVFGFLIIIKKVIYGKIFDNLNKRLEKLKKEKVKK